MMYNKYRSTPNESNDDNNDLMSNPWNHNNNNIDTNDNINNDINTVNPTKQSVDVYRIHHISCQGDYVNYAYEELLMELYNDIYIQTGIDNQSDFGQAVKNVRIRDLRKIDYLTNQHQSFSVMVRRHAILLSADPIRVIVTASTLYIVINTNDAASRKMSLSIVANLQIAMKEWRSAQRHVAYSHLHQVDKHSLTSAVTDDESSALLEAYANISFEAHVYESVVALLVSMQMEDVKSIQYEVNQTVAQLRKTPLLSFHSLEKFRSVKQLITKEEYKLSQYLKGFSELLEEDEVLAMMNLRLFRQSPDEYKYPLEPQVLMTHDQLEGALEIYLMDMSAAVTNAESLKSQLLAAEESISLRLNIMENISLEANKVLQALAVAIALSNVIAGAGGMNLSHSNPHGSFLAVTFGALGLIPVTFACVFWLSTKSPLVHARQKKR